LIVKPRLLAISPPCHTPVNRAIFAELADTFGIAVHLVVPMRLFVGGKWRDTPKVNGPFPYELTHLPLTGTHGRLQRFENLANLVKAWRPTHVFLDNDPGTVMAWQVATAAKAIGAKAWCMTAENLPPNYFRDFLEGLAKLKPNGVIGPLITAFIRTMVHPKFDRIFTLSDDGTRVMETLGFKGKVTKVPLGFDPNLFLIQKDEEIAQTRKKLGLTQTTIAYFGRLTHEKGVHLLLEALRGMLNEPWHLLLDHFSEYRTPYSEKLQGMIENFGLADRVVFFESSHEMMPNFMNAADLVVLPSITTRKWKEQYGRVVPEAMACGKMVIASDSGAIPEILGNRGVIFKEGSVEGLRSALQKCLKIPKETLAKKGCEASFYAKNFLSTSRQAEIMSQLLKVTK